MTEQENKISLEDNSDQDPPSGQKNKMSEGEQKKEEQPKDEQKDEQKAEKPTEATNENPLGLTPDAPEKQSFYERPEAMGNKVGDTIQGALNPVGQYAGKGFETAAKPLGGLIEPLVGGVMKTGEAFGNQANVGFGNKDGGPAKAGELEAAKLKEGLGGKEQKGDNPLGL